MAPTENWAKVYVLRHGHVMTPLGTSDESAPWDCAAQLALISEEAEAEELSFSESPVSIVAPDGLSAMGQAASARGYLWVPIAAPGPAYRGRLGLYIEESIERELEERGALAPGIQSTTGLDASLSDQLYRARLLEMRGLALGVSDLSGIANLGRALDAEDSAVLRWWIAATAERPVRLVLSQANTDLRVYPSPVWFYTLLQPAPGCVTPRPPDEAMAQSSEVMELSELPPGVSLDHHTSVLGTTWEERWGSDVELSELDFALGLRTKEPTPLQQLTLGYDAQVSPGENHETEPPLSEDSSEPIIEAACEPIVPEYGGAQLHAQDPVPDELANDGLDELDADDFLRKLAEDSSSGPEVQAEPVSDSAHHPDDVARQAPLGKPSASAETTNTVPSEIADAPSAIADAPSAIADAPSAIADAPSEIADAPAGHQPMAALAQSAAPISRGSPLSTPAAGPVPLPTKKIERRPFIRLAQDQGSEPAQSGEPVASEMAALATAPEPVVASAALSEQEGEPSAAVPVLDPNDPFNQLAARQWKSWVKNLEAARGPKPLSAIERMFVTDYTRLKEAVRRGVADASAQAILDEWRQSFKSSYAEAFDALRVRGKRPTMVLDLPELAGRLGRLQGAQRVQLLLVDGMRFDLGLMVQERMRARAEASLTERLLLWSALPSVTSYQLELLGKGPDGLKETPCADETEALVARGRGAATPRRIRTGALELLKLDIVEDALRQPGRPVLERLEGLAESTANAILEYFAKLPPRTMVVVFGDHGFDLDPKATGTTEEVLRGGASPEEVLVPAFAWLIGAVH